MKTLRSLPNRIEQLASEIEWVNSAEWYRHGESPELAFPKEAEATQGVLDDLPEKLRVYARNLRRRSEEVGKLRKGVARGNVWDFELKLATLRLATKVRDITGKGYWKELSALIHAAFGEAGPPEWVKDADELRRFCNDNKRLIPTLRSAAIGPSSPNF